MSSKARQHSANALPPESSLAAVLSSLGHTPAARLTTASDYLAPRFSLADAIALQGALQLPTVDDEQQAVSRVVAEAVAHRQALVAQLQGALRGDQQDTDGPLFPEAPQAVDSLEHTPYADWFKAHQGILALGARRLRVQVREALSQHSPAMARIAALDSQFEQALQSAVREASATLRKTFGQHFPKDLSDDATLATALADYRRVAEQLLMAELDWRLAPVVGLLQALTDIAEDTDSGSKEDTSL